MGSKYNESDVLFLGMNVPNETRKLTNISENKATYGMTTSEQRAYQLGVDNTLNCLKSILHDPEHLIVNLTNVKNPEEFTSRELNDYYISNIMLGYTE